MRPSAALILYRAQIQATALKNRVTTPRLFGWAEKYKPWSGLCCSR